MTRELDQLVAWFSRCQRDLPWRKSPTFYRVWVSEVMLQQTTVKAVIPYYNRWMAAFPSIESLVQADEEVVLALWAGLGYYRRLRSLLQTARLVDEVGIPNSAAQLRNLPGVGEYTANAIASIAFGEPVAVVDGNVERVYSRLTGDAEVGGKLKANARNWAEKQLRTQSPGVWNQALMELGATICIPNSPKCGECPIAAACVALEQGLVDKLPTPKPKPQMNAIEFTVEAPVCWEEQWFIGHRAVTHKSWWKGMKEFPTFEARSALENEIGSFRHTVTNNRIQFRFGIRLMASKSRDLVWTPLEEAESLAWPAPYKKILTAIALHLTAGAPSADIRSDQ